MIHSALPALLHVAATPRAAPELALASHAADAAALFGNMQGTAALLTGGLVPLASFAGPKPQSSDSPNTARLKRLHMLVAWTSLVSERTAIMCVPNLTAARLTTGMSLDSAELILLCDCRYATIARNVLLEAAVPHTHSLKELLLRGEYALAWTGVNSHFLFGLLGFVSTVSLNAWLSFGCNCAGGRIGPALACGASSALLLMLSVVNSAVGKGDAQSVQHLPSLLGLFQRYAFLLLAEVFVRRKMLIGIAIALSAVAVVQGALWVVQVPGD